MNSPAQIASCALPEHEQVLAWGRGAVRPTPDMAVGDLFGVACRRYADRPAVVWRDQVLSYAELRGAANRLACSLQHEGVGVGTTVALSMPRGSSMVVAMLGILRAGAAYVPIDPELPAERRAFLLRDSGASLELSDVAQLPSRGPDDDPEPVTASADVAYVIYTSGSTGAPKGVVVEHRSVVDFVFHNAAAYAVGPQSRMLALASLSFDVSVAEILTTLTSGGTLVVADSADRSSPARLQRTLRDRRITVAELPPALLGLLDPDDLPDLRLVSVGGEAPAPSEVRRWVRAGHRVINAYGPTEATVTATLMEADASERASIPIGRPMANHCAYVLDDGLALVAPGVAGELWLAGRGLARGYLDRPELTRERFLADPFGGGDDRMYRTGDRVRWDSDGNLEFLGRIDEQLNVNGYRIEAGEVEARLVAHASVAAAAVDVRTDHGGGARLVGYVVARPGVAAPTARELEAWCAEGLPGPLVPKAFTALDSLPLTANGKTDRPALPAPAAAGERSCELRGACTSVEAAVLDLWHELLPVTEIDREDDFFELGGHSLLAMRMLTRLRSRFGVELEASALHDARSVAAIAALLESAAPLASAEATEPAAPGDPSLPSLAQQRLWLVDRLGSGRGAYNVPIVLRIRGELDRPALERALDDVLARHEELRVRFPALDGQPRRIADPARTVTLAVDDLGCLGRCAEVVRDEVTTSFDLSAGPLWRARLIALGPGDHVFVLVLHHIVCDGWSLSILLDDLGARYAAHRSGMPSPLAAPSANYASFAAAQRARLSGAGARLSGAIDFWREELNGAPSVLDLPADHERPPVQTYAAGSRRETIPPDAVDALRGLARSEGQTLFVVLLAAFSSLLGRLTGSDDVIVACPVAGRPEPDLEAVVGFFIDMVAVRGELGGDPSFIELMRRVGARLRRALGRQPVPFDMVVDALRPARDLSRNPLAQVALNFHSYPDERLELAGLIVEEHPVEPSGALFDLTLHARERAGGLELEAVYRSDLYDPARIDELLRQFTHLLSQVARSPSRAVAGCSLRPPGSSASLPTLEAELSPAAGPTVVERFRAQAARTPDRTAVQGAGGGLTYAQLLRRSETILARARRAGYGDGTRVALLARRDPDFVGELLGLMGARAVPVLVDRQLPPARQEALIEAAQPCMTAGQPHIGPQPSGEQRREVGLDDDAYVLFTSGSSGSPKPVLAAHRPLAHFLDWYLEAFSITEADRFAALSGVAHDPVLRDVLAPLCVGASAHMPAPEVHRAPVRLLRWLADEAITVMHTTPQLARMLAHAATEAGAPALCALRLVAFGGDVVREDDAARWRALAPNATLASFYGATETPQGVSCAVLDADPVPGGGRHIPLGPGIADVQLLVVGPAGQPAGVGEVGEIWVRTPHLARGYLSDPGLTAARFLDELRGGRRYATGDLGRYRLDGRVEFLGRRDRQLKIRGFRVEPGEVTAAIARLPGVRACHVAGLAAADGERSLSAYVAGAGLDAEQIQFDLRSLLPEYMVPERVVVMDTLPVSANGKLDLAALEVAPARTGHDGYRPPSTATERLVAGIWRDVLGVGVVGRDDNFFDVGGNSLRLAQVQARLSAAVDREITIVDLFRYPTVRTVCAFLGRGAERSRVTSSAPRRASARRDLRARRPVRPRVVDNRKERL